MRHRPLNADTPFSIWSHFDPGQYIEFNPSFVRLHSGQAYAVIRRDRVPPVPGKGTIWTVAVDDAMRPTGRPFPLVADGEDPRAVLVGERVLVFYVLFERNAAGVITGTSMALAEFDPRVEPWAERAHFRLPKDPLGVASAGSQRGWEKNWVPFAVSDRQVGLIYSHDPWQVLVLNVDASLSERRFEQAFRGDALNWPEGDIRGGTPPLRCGEHELITFFHSSAVIGSRRSYMVGACVFQDQPPFQPLRMTSEPLLVAPYLGGMHRHGWAVAASVVFPLGAQAVASGWQLLCGLDDGEIGSFVVPQEELDLRMIELPRPPAALLQHLGGATLPADGPVLYQGAGEPAADLPLLRFLAMAAPRGRTLLDVGGDGGLFMVGLASGYRQVEAVASTVDAARWRARTLALNELPRPSATGNPQGIPITSGQINLHLPTGCAGKLAEAGGLVARSPWRLDQLDGLTLADVDLIVLQAPVATGAVAILCGLQQVLARDHPLLLLRLAPDGSEYAPVQALLAPLGYTMEVIFPRSPGTAWCTHPARRAEISWFV